jgi:hypothetical protein
VTDFAPRLNVLPPPQRAVWDLLTCIPSTFVLYGGTAIALRLAHRASIDFDFFSNEPFTPADLLRRIEPLPTMQRLQSERNTLTVVIGNDDPVKVSFFGELKLCRVGQPHRVATNGVAIASLLDLAATKMAVVQDRAEQKDYLDIAALVAAGVTLEQSLAAAKTVYGSAFNPAITLKALTYFEDGELVSLPDTVKQTLTDAATKIGSLPKIPPASDGITRSD